MRRCASADAAAREELSEELAAARAQRAQLSEELAAAQGALKKCQAEGEAAARAAAGLRAALGEKAALEKETGEALESARAALALLSAQLANESAARRGAEQAVEEERRGRRAEAEAAGAAAGAAAAAAEKERERAVHSMAEQCAGVEARWARAFQQLQARYEGLVAGVRSSAQPFLSPMGALEEREGEGGEGAAGEAEGGSGSAALKWVPLPTASSRVGLEGGGGL